MLNGSKIPDLLENEKKANLMRVGIIFFFGLGSVVGGFAFRAFEYWGFLIPTFTSGLLFGAMVYFQVLNAKKSRTISDSA